MIEKSAAAGVNEDDAVVAAAVAAVEEQLKLQCDESLKQPIARDAYAAVSKVLKTYWSTYVPDVFMLGPSLFDAYFEPQEFERLLLKPLAYVLCGERNALYEELSSSGHASASHQEQLCGHQFSGGEPTYTCRDCAADPTCVLCFDCFSNSAHRNHKYRIATSGGSGYCDCGDVEAWKTEPLCAIAAKRLNRIHSSSAAACLTDATLDRMKIILACVLKYCIDLLFWDDVLNLPAGLTLGSQSSSAWQDTYQTVLYNDESHSYDQVIKALVKAIDCDGQQATMLATKVDGEGRTSVRFGPKTYCDRAKSVIEQKTTRDSGLPLVVKTMRSAVYAHQQFAQALLARLCSVLGELPLLTPIVSDMLMNKFAYELPVDDVALAEKLLRYDVKWWKGARFIVHRLLMSTVLIDPGCRQDFARLFTRMYNELMMAHINDDHEHSVSVVALSVQIFTVRSVARMLITEEDLICVVLKPLLTVAEEYVLDKDSGILTFQQVQTRSPMRFRRSLNVLNDLRYILTNVPSPEDWDFHFQSCFMFGMQSLLDVLCCMHGMDPVVRQVGAHQEFSPEWETAFTIQLRLTAVLALVQQWCSTCPPVSLLCLAATRRRLAEWSRNVWMSDTVTIAGHSVICIAYDVASKPVSIHIPLARLVAGLYLNATRVNSRQESLPPEAGSDALQHTYEQNLRVLALCAQVQANMWKRNGYSLLNQIHNYFGSVCRSEMFDKDILMLQAGASMDDPDSFIVAVLHKFGLHNWAQEGYENNQPESELTNQVTILAEEFLHLLIIILGQRFTLGIGQVSPSDAVRMEVIHLLCRKPMTMSKLERHLPEDPCDKTGLEEVVKSVANFRPPTDGAAGHFELKPECLNEYNPFFWHYTKAEMSEAEDYQRKLRASSAFEIKACPPSALPEFCPAFLPIIKLFESDVFLHVIALVLDRTKRKSRLSSDGQLHRVLFLIGMALNEEEHYLEKRSSKKGSKAEGSDTELQQCCFTSRVKQYKLNSQDDIYAQLVGLVGRPNVAHTELLLQWTILRFQSILKLHGVTSDDSGQQAQHDSDVSGLSAEEQNRRKRRHEIALKQRQKAVEQIEKMQHQFIEQNKALLAKCSTALQNDDERQDQEEVVSPARALAVCVGPNRTAAQHLSAPLLTCVLCQEQQQVAFDSRAIVYAAFVQNSAVFSKEPGRILTQPDELDPLHAPASLYYGVHTSACGHAMHAECWQQFYDALIAKEQRNHWRHRLNSLFNVEFNEYLCPMCKRLCNTVLPVVPPLQLLVTVEYPVSRDYEQFLTEIDHWLQRGVADASCPATATTTTETNAAQRPVTPKPTSGQQQQGSSKSSPLSGLFRQAEIPVGVPISESVEEMIRTFSQAVYSRGLLVEPHFSSPKVSIMNWLTVAFTIRSLDAGIAFEQKPLLGALNTRRNCELYGLVHCVALCSYLGDGTVFRTHLRRLLLPFFVRTDVADAEQLPNVLELDMFTTLVELTYTIEWMRTDKERTVSAHAGVAVHHLLRLVLSAYLLQLLFTAEPLPDDEDGVQCTYEDPKGVSALQDLRSQVCSWVEASVSTVEPADLFRHVLRGLTSFLRWTSLFLHALSYVAPPEELCDYDTDLFAPMCSYLDIPQSVAELVQFLDRASMERWCRVPSTAALITSKKIVRQPVLANDLIDLPKDFSILINKASQRSCPTLQVKEPRYPALCLVCGEMVCARSYCCQRMLNGHAVGGCTYHAHCCSSGTGIFLSIRDCRVILIYQLYRGWFMPAPYVDEYGETDLGFKRGNPLFLSEQLYRKLRSLWLNHAIPEQIVSRIELSDQLLTQEWPHF